jgi:hypothetical protein
MSQVGRIITVVMKVVESSEAGAVWDAHLKRGLISGCHVLKISDGDLVEEVELHEQYLEEMCGQDANGVDMNVDEFHEWKEKNT